MFGRVTAFAYSSVYKSPRPTSRSKRLTGCVSSQFSRPANFTFARQTVFNQPSTSPFRGESNRR
jgi:hypothetical protein